MTTITNDDYGIATAADTVTLERSLPGPIERVWAYLTEADKRKQWLAGGNMEPRAGGKAELLFRHSEFADEPTPKRFKEVDDGVSARVEVREWNPPHRLAISWPDDGHDSEVTFELFAEGDRVRLVLTHTRLRDAAQMANVASGWHAHFAVLEAVLEGRPAMGFWSDVLRLEAEYSKRLGPRSIAPASAA